MTTTDNSADVLAGCPNPPGFSFRAWLQWSIEQARFNRDTLDPKAAEILTNVLEEYDARRTESADDALLREALEENIALRCLLGGGCDANSDGPHETIVTQDKARFCADCGEMVNAKGQSKPWFHGDRLERAKERIAHLSRPRPARDEALEEAAKGSNFDRCMGAISNIHGHLESIDGEVRNLKDRIRQLKGQKP